MFLRSSISFEFTEKFVHLGVEGRIIFKLHPFQSTTIKLIEKVKKGHFERKRTIHVWNPSTLEFKTISQV